jgi:hypothetical protein
MEDDDVDQPYKTPAALQKAGVLFALNDNNEETVTAIFLLMQVQQQLMALPKKKLCSDHTECR